jgi:hypothetical protein
MSVAFAIPVKRGKRLVVLVYVVCFVYLVE